MAEDWKTFSQPAHRVTVRGCQIFVVALFHVVLTGTYGHAADPGARERSFVRSLEVFDSAKSPDEYRESAKIMESILADGFRNGAVYYNLGNAYYRAGDYGRAILNYRKATPYLPGDPYLTANLQQALAVAPGRLAEPARPWWTHILFWTDWVSFPSKVYLSFAACTLAAAVSVIAVVVRRRRLHWVSTGLLVASAIVAVDIALCYRETIDSQRAVIVGETIARKGTGLTYEPAFDQPLRDGAEFQILTETPDWTFGHFESIGDGWVRNEFVAR